MKRKSEISFPSVGDGSGLAQSDSFYREELQLALRNRGMLLEGIRYPITPTGMHYLLIHYDVPEVNINTWRLQVGGLVSNPLSLTLDRGDPVTLIKLRALMIPPRIPDFMTRTRLVQAGPVSLSGRAWAGRLSVSRVEVSVDGGSTWSEAQLGEPISPYAWRPWTFLWSARPGGHTLCVRATDSEGNVQPLDQQWNFGGYGNNTVQRVSVVVE